MMHVTRILVASLIVLAPNLHTCGHHVHDHGFAPAEPASHGGIAGNHTCPACTFGHSIVLSAPVPTTYDLATTRGVVVAVPSFATRCCTLLDSFPPRAPPA